MNKLPKEIPIAPKSKVNNAARSREAEWNFDHIRERIKNTGITKVKPQKLPKDSPHPWQVRFCVNYEYARESQIFTSAVKNLREKMRPAPGTPFNIFNMPFGMTKKNCWVLKSVLAFMVPEFPETPWLDIPMKRRIEILRPIDITESKPLLGYGFKDHGHPEACFKAVSRGDRFAWFDNQAAFLLEFDFKEGDDFILEGLKAWLKEVRAGLPGARRDPRSPYCPSKLRKGKARNLSVYWQALYDLSLYRRRVVGIDPKEIRAWDAKDPKTEAAALDRARKLIALFDERADGQWLGFVEYLLEQTPKSELVGGREFGISKRGIKLYSLGLSLIEIEPGESPEVQIILLNTTGKTPIELIIKLDGHIIDSEKLHVPAGGIRNYPISLCPIYAEGEHSIIVTLTRGHHQIAEKSFSLHVKPAPASLMVESLVLIPPWEVPPGGQVNVTARIRNVGGKKATNVRLPLFVNDLQQTTFDISLDPGEETEIKAEFTAPSGDHCEVNVAQAKAYIAVVAPPKSR